MHFESFKNRLICWELKLMFDMRSKLQERDFSGTPYVPVYVLLPDLKEPIVSSSKTLCIGNCGMPPMDGGLPSRPHSNVCTKYTVQHKSLRSQQVLEILKEASRNGKMATFSNRLLSNEQVEMLQRGRSSQGIDHGYDITGTISNPTKVKTTTMPKWISMPSSQYGSTRNLIHVPFANLNQVGLGSVCSGIRGGPVQ
ncbi:hypothetical protein M8C21_032931 [Ambrosia artemisiifolia]|uniref:Uncharacterized protein n=1 Tax=Ambrosia artemisiifolia TaxID=4212 RepID=A0AAD5D8F1_AMBAR|nr:hypothetical protein M8C21_032931 [Ambrosia artemisiifolia]